MSLCGRRIGVVIPTRNEANALPRVLAAMPGFVDCVVVGDFDSSDGTPEIARTLGAVVVGVSGPGYGRACLEAIAALPPVDIIVFVDGDAADDLSAMERLVAPIVDGTADFVLGSRVLGRRERGSLTPQQIFGNWLACSLLRLRWGTTFTDLGPFRAIRSVTLRKLSMSDANYGWTVEMQIKSASLGKRAIEIPVDYRRRIGTSKVSGTVAGSIKAGAKILWVIGREALERTQGAPRDDR